MNVPAWLFLIGFFLSIVLFKTFLILCRHKKLGVPLRWEKDFDQRSPQFIENYKINWRADLDEWNERHPWKKWLRVIPIISSLVEIVDLFSSDPFPVVWVFEEE